MENRLTVTTLRSCCQSKQFLWTHQIDEPSVRLGRRVVKLVDDHDIEMRRI
jgi:hypothetical protein